MYVCLTPPASINADGFSRSQLYFLSPRLPYVSRADTVYCSKMGLTLCTSFSIPVNARHATSEGPEFTDSVYGHVTKSANIAGGISVHQDTIVQHTNDPENRWPPRVPVAVRFDVSPPLLTCSPISKLTRIASQSLVQLFPKRRRQVPYRKSRVGSYVSNGSQRSRASLGCVGSMTASSFILRVQFFNQSPVIRSAVQCSSIIMSDTWAWKLHWSECEGVQGLRDSARCTTTSRIGDTRSYLSPFE